MMPLFNVYGKLVKKNVNKHLIKWDGKSRSKLQYQVKQFLKPHWKNHICYEEFPAYGCKLKVDILNATLRIAVEINGPQHSKFNPFFHNNSRTQFFHGIQRDMRKREWLEKNDFQLIEINEDEIPKLSRDFIKEKFGVDIF